MKLAYTYFKNNSSLGIKNHLTLLFLVGVFTTSMAQSQTELSRKQLKTFHKNPVWIEMMEDSTVNYYTAKIAFEEFWKGKVTPGEEGHTLEEKQSRKSFLGALFSKDADAEKFTWEYKQFSNWLRVKAAYVKSDGTLMSEDELQAIIREELKRREEDAAFLRTRTINQD